MIETETLLVFAELAVAFAGFASVVSVVAGGKLSELPLDYRWSLRGMLVCSLSVCFLAITPIVLDRFEFHADQVWRTSGVVLSIVGVFLVVGGVRDSRMIAAKTNWLSRYAWLSPIAISTSIGFVLAFEFAPAHADAIFLSGLVGLLLLSAALFGNIVMSQVAPRD